MTDATRELLADCIRELKVARGDANIPDHLHPSSELIRRIRAAIGQSVENTQPTAEASY